MSNACGARAQPRGLETTRSVADKQGRTIRPAFLGKGQTSEAEQELAKLKEIKNDASLDQPLFSPNTGRAILSIAQEVLSGEIAAAKKDYNQALAHLERAVRLEDAFVYTEPSEFHYPPRHALGAVLLAANRAPEAETVYWEDLRRNRENGHFAFGTLSSKNDVEAIIERSRPIQTNH